MPLLKARNSRSLPNKKGFTLVEAISSAVILGIGLIIVAIVFYEELRNINKLRETTIATLAIQEGIEQVRAKPFNDILNLGSSFTATGFTYLKNPVGTIAIDNIYGDSNIRRVSVTVIWNSLYGGTLSKSIATLITRNGIDKQ